MNWERWFCSHQACASDAWMVQRDPAMYNVWKVAAHMDDHPFTVAATAPICPRCGTTLLTMVKLEGRLDRHVDAEVGSVFDFARGLS